VWTERRIFKLYTWWYVHTKTFGFKELTLLYTLFFPIRILVYNEQHLFLSSWILLLSMAQNITFLSKAYFNWRPYDWALERYSNITSSLGYRLYGVLSEPPPPQLQQYPPTGAAYCYVQYLMFHNMKFVKSKINPTRYCNTQYSVSHQN
jgi:hypothetical protein